MSLLAGDGCVWLCVQKGLVGRRGPVRVFSSLASLHIGMMGDPMGLAVLRVLESESVRFSRVIAGANGSGSAISIRLGGLERGNVVSCEVRPISGEGGVFCLGSGFLKSMGVSRPGRLRRARSRCLVGGVIRKSKRFSALLFRALGTVLVRRKVGVSPVLGSANGRVNGSVFGGLCSRSLSMFVDGLTSF